MKRWSRKFVEPNIEVLQVDPGGRSSGGESSFGKLSQSDTLAPTSILQILAGAQFSRGFATDFLCDPRNFYHVSLTTRPLRPANLRQPTTNAFAVKHQNTAAMGRLHSKGKGISSSATPYSRTPPSWLKTTPDQVVEQICRLAKRGATPSQIGVILRDSHGIAQVRFVTGTLLSSSGCAQKSIQKTSQKMGRPFANIAGQQVTRSCASSSPTVRHESSPRTRSTKDECDIV